MRRKLALFKKLAIKINFRFAVNLFVLGYEILQSWILYEYIQYFEIYRSRRSFISWLSVGRAIGWIFFGFITVKFDRKKLSFLYMSVLLMVSVQYKRCELFKQMYAQKWNLEIKYCLLSI